jgi:hypothetical protein
MTPIVARKISRKAIITDHQSSDIFDKNSIASPCWIDQKIQGFEKLFNPIYYS